MLLSYQTGGHTNKAGEYFLYHHTGIPHRSLDQKKLHRSTSDPESTPLFPRADAAAFCAGNTYRACVGVAWFLLLHLLDSGRVSADMVENATTKCLLYLFLLARGRPCLMLEEWVLT